MVKQIVQPPGDNIKKAIRELSELLLKEGEKNRPQLLQKIGLKYDLSPHECEFLNRHFSGIESKPST